MIVINTSLVLSTSKLLALFYSRIQKYFISVEAYLNFFFSKFVGLYSSISYKLYN